MNATRRFAASGTRRRFRRVAVVLPFAVLALVLPACGGDNDSGGASGSSAPAQDPAALEGKSWIVTQILGTDGQSQIVDIGIDASFDGSSISGAVSCNSYNASYTATGGDISFGPIATTLKACPPDEQAIADQYLQLLQAAASFEISGRSMSMSNADGTPTIQFSEG